MDKKRVMIVTGAAPISQAIAAWAGNAGDRFECTFINSDEDAIQMALQQLFDMVIVDAAGDLVITKKLTALLPLLQLELMVLTYKGETAGELRTRVQSAFAKRKAERIRRIMVLDAPDGENHDRLSWFSVN